MIRAATPELRPQSAGQDARKYKQTLDRVLVTFEAVEQWPDNIAFLTRLLRVLQTYPTIREIPSKTDVADALALCLLPTLPNGVHQKALEIYEHTFALLGAESLASDLAIWLPGLLPVLSFASVSLKSTLVDLISTFVVPLRSSLRPVARDLILSMLPGVEDEHDEAFDAVLKLLDELQLAITDDTLWWTSVWLATILAQSTQRSGALNYLQRRMPGALKDVSVCLGPDPGMPIRAFVAGLTDPDILNQRGFLELLVSHLPLSAKWMQKLPEAELQSLMSAAAQIVLRKDLGLNKRLWAWLLGKADEDGKLDPNYINYGGQRLVAALRQDMSEAPIRTCRVLLSLLDKQELASLLTIDAVEPLVRACQAAEKAGKLDDLNASARALFDALPTSAIFRYLWLLFERSNYADMAFIFKVFDFQDEEMILQQLPRFMLALTDVAEEAALMLAGTIAFVLTPKSLVTPLPSISGKVVFELCVPGESVNTQALVGDVWLDLCLEKLVISPFTNVADQGTSTNKVLSLLYEILRRRVELGPVDTAKIIQFGMEINGQKKPHYEHVVGLVKVLEASQTKSKPLCRQLTEHLITSLHRDEPQMIPLIESLSSVYPVEQLETQIARKIAVDLAETPTPNLRRFAALYRELATKTGQQLLSKSIILVADALSFGSLTVKTVIRRWMRKVDSTLMLRVLRERLLDCMPETVYMLRIQNTQVSVSQLNSDPHALVYHLNLLASFARTTEHTKYGDIYWVFAKAALQLRHTDSSVLLSLAESALDIMHQYPVSWDEARTCLQGSLLLAVKDHHYALQIMLLQSLGKHMTDTPDWLVPILVWGIEQARTEWALQEWLDFCLQNPLPHEVVRCLCEQVDLCIAEMEDAIMTDSVEDQGAYDNAWLLLEALLRMQVAGETMKQQEAGILQPSSEAEAQRHLVQTQLHAQVIHFAVHIWTWSAQALQKTDSKTRAAPIHRLQNKAIEIICSRYEHRAEETMKALMQSWENEEAPQFELQNIIGMLEETANLPLTVMTKILCTHFTVAQAKFVHEILRPERSAEKIEAATPELLALIRLMSAGGNFSEPGMHPTMLTLGASISLKLVNLPKKTRKEVNDCVIKLLGQTLSNLTSEAYSTLPNFIRILPVVFKSLDKASAAMTLIMTQLVQPQLRSKKPKEEVLTILEAMSNVEGLQKAWRPDVQNYFAEAAFFEASWEQGRQWSRIFRPWISLDKDKVNEYLLRPHPSAPKNPFVSYESERLFKVSQNQRLVFLMMALPIDALMAQVGLLQDRLHELSDKLLGDALFLMRAMVLRISPAHLKNQWPLFVSLLKRAFNKLLEEIQEPLLVSACETLDVLLASRIEDFQMYVFLFCLYKLTIATNGSLYETRMKQSLMHLALRRHGWIVLQRSSATPIAGQIYGLANGFLLANTCPACQSTILSGYTNKRNAIWTSAYGVACSRSARRECFEAGSR
jgi:hypothetical protein